jgi:signal transduction histidine kinase
MTKAVAMVEEGEVKNLPPLPIPNNEIGVLSIAFAKMLDSIKLKIEAMAQDRRDLEEINQSLELRVGSRTKELRTALNEMIKKERLAAIGQMASIVSHEIKNPLAVMANSVYLIKARVGENADPKLLKNISVIEQEIKQANGIIEEILGYARSREQILSVADLNLYMKEIVASYPIPSNVKVTMELYEKPLPVKIDAEEMKQGIRNVIGNAVEVMPAGGQLVIKT